MDDDPDGRPDPEQQQGGVMSLDGGQVRIRNQGVEPQQHADDDEVVGDGDEHGCGELALSVEQRRHEGDQSIASELWDEPAQQEGGHHLLLMGAGVVVGRGVEVDDRRGQDEERHCGHQHDRHRDGHH